MDFRQCVLSSLEDSQIVAAFNRNEHIQWTRVELKTWLGEGDLDVLDSDRRESVARYLLFVHANLWVRLRDVHARHKEFTRFKLERE